jgi:NUMOD3 motif-containing protein
MSWKLARGTKIWHNIIMRNFKNPEKTKKRMAENAKRTLNGFKKGHKINVGRFVGRAVSEMTKEKIRQTLTGRKLSDETRQKLSIALKGKNTWMKGRKLSVETRRKQSDAHKGEKAPNWQGGKTSLLLEIRHSFKYRQWRSDVFTRDDFTCSHCAQRGGHLNADHIKPFSFLIKEYEIDSFEKAMECEELWNINNGRTLCLHCHKKTDTYLVKARHHHA